MRRGAVFGALACCVAAVTGAGVAARAQDDRLLAQPARPRGAYFRYTLDGRTGSMSARAGGDASRPPSGRPCPAYVIRTADFDLTSDTGDVRALRLWLRSTDGPGPARLALRRGCPGAALQVQLASGPATVRSGSTSVSMDVTSDRPGAWGGLRAVLETATGERVRLVARFNLPLRR